MRRRGCSDGMPVLRRTTAVTRNWRRSRVVRGASFRPTTLTGAMDESQGISGKNLRFCPVIYAFIVSGKNFRQRPRSRAAHRDQAEGRTGRTSSPS
jgi:hypothetical protein